MLLMDQDISCNTGSSSNPNLTAIFEIYKYDSAKNVYISTGRTKVSKTLITCVSKSDEFVNSNGIVQLDLEKIP